MSASRHIPRLAIGGMIVVFLSLVALTLMDNVLQDGHTRELSRAGVQTSGHLRALQALGQIDTHTDLLEEEGLGGGRLEGLEEAKAVLRDSLRRMQAPGVVEWERRLARAAEPQVDRIEPAIHEYIDAIRTDADDITPIEDHMDELLEEVQRRFSDIGADPSENFREALAAAAADNRRLERRTLILVPLGLLFVALCGWQLRAYGRRSRAERLRIEAERSVSQRLESAGQLAAGIAHEINTPVQFVGDSVRFVQEAFGDLFRLIGVYRAHAPAAAAEELAAAEEAADLEYLEERVPAALDRSLDGLGRVAAIVGAMKEFGRPTQVERAAADINDALRSTLVVCQNEYKYVADVETEFGELPPVVCNIGELNQAFLNLIVNAAHAIAEADGSARGAITVSTARENGSAIVSISDTGPGIPKDIRERIFDPFFTTKEVGKGTGQGLAITRSIVDKHGGTLTVDTEVGRGTTFAIRVPIGDAAPAAV